MIQLRKALKFPQITEITKILQMITNLTIFCVPGLKKITLLYTSVPIGVGRPFIYVTLFRSKIGLRGQNFQDK